MEGSQTISIDTESLLIETLTCLQKTFTEKDNIERKKAEQRLKELEDNIILHFKITLQTLSRKEINQDLKLSIILYLKNVLSNKLDNRSFSKSDVLQIVQTYIEMILQSNLEDALLQNLNIGLTLILNSSYMREDPSLVTNICDYLLNFFKEETSEEIRLVRCKPLIMLNQCIISSSCSNNENILQIASKQFEAVDLMINLLTHRIGNLDNKSNEYLNCIDILRCLLDFLFLCLLKSKKVGSINDVMPVYINKYLPFAVGSLLFSYEKNLISFTSNKEYDNYLNSMKAKSFQLVSYIVQTEGNTIKNEKIVENLSSVVPVIISSLENVINERMAYIFEMSKESVDFPDNSYDALLFQILLFLSRFLSREPIITSFTTYIKNFVLTIIMPFLMTSKREIIKMKTDGQEHYSFSLDVQSEHKLKNYKVSASFLLIKLCEKYDGLANHILNFSLQVIDYCLNNSEVSLLPRYGLLNSNDVGIQKILTGLSAEVQIDTCLEMLLILREFVSKSSQSMAILRLVLESQAEKILSINSDIIKDKLCFLFGYFLDELYRDDEVEPYFNHLQNIFSFLFSQVLNFQSNPGTAYSASFAINQLIVYKGYGDVTNSIVKKIMPQLIDQIKEIEVTLFYDILIEIVLYLDVEDYLILLSREVTNRMLKEIKSPKNKKEKEMNVYVSKCFNILRTVLEKNNMLDYDRSNLDQNVEVVIEPNSFQVEEFEKIIEPLVAYLKNPSKINFDDEIIFLLISFLNNTKKITPLCKYVFPFLQMYEIKYEGMNDELFELINLYIEHDKEDFLIEKAEVFSNIIKTSIQDGEDDIFSPILGSLLTQSWLQSKTNIPEDIVVDLLNLNLSHVIELYHLLKSNFEDLGEAFSTLPFASYLTTIYSALINYPNLVLSKLNDIEKFTKFINCTELLINFEYFSTYQSKIIVLGICSLLTNESVLQSQSEYIKKFLHFSFLFLIRQKNEETRKLKGALKKEIECNFILSEDEEDYEESDEEESTTRPISSKKMSKMRKNANKDSDLSKEERHLNKITSKLKFLKGIDEYDIFHRTLYKVNSFNSQIIPEWEKDLSEVQKLLWSELSHTRRITIDHSGVKMEVPRRTVKIRRSQP